jgi:membrane-bound lytic murein transglycosylase D
MRAFQPFIILLLCTQLWAQPEREPYDYIPDVPDSTIVERLAALNAEIPLRFTPEVKKYIQYYTITRRRYVKTWLNRAQKYFPIFEEHLRAHGLPEELKYLSIVESGLNPKAISSAAAVGLWQFIYYTGKKYDLQSNWYYDDRMDPDKATQAACNFLKYLYGYFGDWELALAGYNSGPGRVNRAIRYADDQRDFLAIYEYLPRETRAYVPKFVAVTYLFEYAEEHNLFPDAPEYLPDYDTIHISQYLHLPTFSESVGICMEDLEALNPQIKHGALPATARNYPLKIPSDIKENFLIKRDSILEVAGNVARTEIERMANNEVGAVAGRERVLYKVKSGDVLGLIAQRYGVRVSDIKRWNRLSGTMIRVGQTLKIWVKPNSKPSAPARPAVAQTTTAPRTGQLIHKVQPGDTLWDISRSHNISIEEIKLMNNMSGDAINPGQTLILGAE